MIWRTTALLALGLVAAAAAVVGAGSARFARANRNVVAELLADVEPAAPAALEASTIPEPVARYFERALPADGRRPRSARYEQRGTILQGGAWRPFTAVQHVTADPPGFVWDARVRFAPGVTARVVDRYVRGEGALAARLLGALPVADAPPSEAMNAGELMRFLAEGAWLPTSLLPRSGLTWHATGDRSATATLTDGGTTASVEFHFDEAGDLVRVEGDRPRLLEDGRTEVRRWIGRFWNHTQRDGVRVPLEGEVGWVMHDGLEPYWRGRIERIAFDSS